MTINNKIKSLKSSDGGFTIVELLIVIIVIGILATLVLIAYNNVQAQARDTKRTSDANSLADAAAAFKTESTNGSYPTNTATGFAADLGNATLYPNKTVAVDTTVTNKLSATAPSATAKDNIVATYCGTGTPTAATATGMKFTYWSETKNAIATPAITTGSGC